MPEKNPRYEYGVNFKLHDDDAKKAEKFKNNPENEKITHPEIYMTGLETLTKRPKR